MIRIDTIALAQQRVDSYLAQIIPAMNRSQLSNYTRSIRINGIPVRLSRIVKRGERIQAEVEETSPEPAAEPLPMNILHEDQQLIVINKEVGVVVHPGHGHRHGTIAQGLLHRYSSLRSWPAESNFRPGIVHRLDKETSGVMIAAKDVESAQALQRQFQLRQVHKEYVAIVKGQLHQREGDISAPIARDPLNRRRFAVSPNGRRAYTHFRVIRRFGFATLVLLQPYTGRTHQLRVHMQYCGTPILGERLYNSNFAAGNYKGLKQLKPSRLFLHAYRLHINHPYNGASLLFRAPIPTAFWNMLHLLKQQ